MWPQQLPGFLIVQGANLCFTSGQVGYKRLIANSSLQLEQRTIFAWFFIGALLVTFAVLVTLRNCQLSQLSGDCLFVLAPLIAVWGIILGISARLS
ncbi:hypothetical protein ACVFI8_13720 [Agarivorans sp. MS3-6]